MFFLALLSIVTADPSSDCFHTINAWNSFQNTMIPSSGDCCLLSGVVCSQDKVIEIGWNSTGSVGTLPEEFGYLDQLKVLDLANNSLFGRIPESYYSLSSLENLRLKNNSLTGSLSSFKGLTQLRSLDLSYNQFSDEIPSDSFETLNDLKFINVAGNVDLTGIFPNPGPSTQLISTGNTGVTLCGKAASVAVVAYFGTRQTCPAGYRK